MGDSKLQRWRKERHLSQQQLADYLGVTRTAVYQWESGRTRIQHEQMLRLALQHYDCLKKPEPY